MPNIHPLGHLTPAVSALLTLCILACFLGLMAWALWRIVGHRKVGKAADEAHDLSAPLVVGACLVAGTVELEEGTPFAARVEIKQKGREKHDSENNTTHEWRETKRSTFAHPFWILHASGERILVKPAGNSGSGTHREVKLELVDRLDILVHDAASFRYRIAELSDGEKVIAEGRLCQERVAKPTGGGYRDGAELRWVLHPGPVERLHLSAEKLGGRHRRKAARIQHILLLFYMPSFALALALLSSYAARVVVGQHDVATTTGKRHYTTERDDSTTHHWVIDYTFSGRHGDEHLSHSRWEGVSEGDQFPLIHVPGWRAASAIGNPTTLRGAFGLSAFGLFLLPVFWFRYHVKREWHEGPHHEKGRGKLAKPNPSTFSVQSRE